jgi:hypothetical protein
MPRSFISRTCVASILIMVFPVLVWAQQHAVEPPVLNQQEKKQEEKQQDSRKSGKNEKPDPDKPDIKEVPKARKQSRPEVVVKPNIKVKPIKIIRPKIRRP